MPFNLPYKFQMSGREVVVQHRHNGHVRVSPNNTGLADGGGGEGQYARWRIMLEGGSHCRLQSVRTGKYLRLWRGGREIDVNGGTGPFTKFKIHYHSRPNGVKLESDRFPGKYIAVNPNRTMKIGTGGMHCCLWIKREGQQRVVQQPVRIVQQPQVQVIQSGGGWGLPYMFRQNNTIVVRSNYGKHLRVNPNNYYNADGNGGTGKYARWKVMLDGGNVVKLQNTHSGKYLRIQGGNQVNVGGTGGALTRFKYHIHTSPNGVKLESCRFPGKYVAIRPNGNVMIGSGGIHTRLTFLREGQQVQRVQQPTVVIQQQPIQPIQPQVIVQSPSNQIQQAQIAAQQAALAQQQAQQQAQLAAQKQAMEAQMAAQQAQMQQQMEQMRLQNEASLSQQRAQIQAEKQQMEAQIAAQQQQVLDAQKTLLEQQQAQLSNPSLQQIPSQPAQNEGISSPVSPVNPYYGQSTAGGGDQPQQPSYPVLNQPVQPVQPVVIQSPVQQEPEENKAPEVVPRIGQEAADEVMGWLQKLKMERYYKTFIENGYDQLETIAEISREDLKEMGVALGHIKIIMHSCITAPFMNKRVKLRCVSYQTYLHEYGKPKDMGNGKRCILQHNDKHNKPGNIWVFENTQDQKFRLKHEPTGSWLRSMGAEHGECDTRSPFEERHGTFVLEKEEGSQGIYYIKNERNNCYFKCESPRTLGYNKTAQQEKRDKDCRWNILIQR